MFNRNFFLTLVISFLILIVSPFIVADGNDLHALTQIKDLYHEYEVWSNQGVKFVVRDSNGQFVTWGIGKLESWNGTKTVLCVRDSKGRFLTWANGKIENWKNNQKRYVFRNKAGKFIKWMPLDFTNGSSFKKNLKRLNEIDINTSKYAKLLIEVIYETILVEMKSNNYEKAFRFLSFGFNNSQTEMQKEKIRQIIAPVLKYIKSNFLMDEGNENLKELYTDYNDLFHVIS